MKSSLCKYSLHSTLSPTHEVYKYDDASNDEETSLVGDSGRWYFKWMPKFIASTTSKSNKEQNEPATTPSDIHFVTSRSSKFEEVSKLMSGFNLIQTPLELPTLEKTLDLSLVATYRVGKAYEILKQPCFLEECSMELDIPSFDHPFPGRFFKDVAEGMMGRREFANMFDGRQVKLHSRFAYTADGVTIHIFSGFASGRIYSPFKSDWVEGDGWDPIVILSGYDLPISALTRWKHIIHLRQMPCAEMMSTIKDRDYSGVYETHITVYNSEDCKKDDDNPLKPSRDYQSTFKLVCSKLGVKALVIEMDDDCKPVQLQTAAYHCYKNFSNAQDKAYELAEELIKAGLPVRRVRLEAMLHNEDTPKSDAEALLPTNSGNYFEFHTRLSWIDKKIPLSKKKVDLTSSLKKWWSKNESDCSNGMSRILLSASSSSGTKLFANGRMYGVGAQRALTMWDSIVQHLLTLDYVAEKHVKPEYCVYDESPEADYVTKS